MTPTTPRIAKIMRLSKWLSIVLAGVLVLLPASDLAAIAYSRVFGWEAQVGGPCPVDFAQLSAMTALLTTAVIVVDLALSLLPVFFLQRLFRRWSKGAILDAGAARLIKLTGILMLVSGLASTVLPIVHGVSSQNTCEGDASITFDLGMVLAALAIYLVGLAMAEAAKVAQEAELTI